MIKQLQNTKIGQNKQKKNPRKSTRNRCRLRDLFLCTFWNTIKTQNQNPHYIYKKTYIVLKKRKEIKIKR